MIHQHADIKQLGLAPNLHRHAADLKLLRQFVFALLHAQIVKRDALALPLLLAMPVLRLEAVLGLGRFGAKELVVPIKPFHDELGNLMRLRHGGSLREMIGHKNMADKLEHSDYEGRGRLAEPIQGRRIAQRPALQESPYMKLLHCSLLNPHIQHRNEIQPGGY